MFPLVLGVGENKCTTTDKGSKEEFRTKIRSMVGCAKEQCFGLGHVCNS